MSIALGTTFRETAVHCWALTHWLECAENIDAFDRLTAERQIAEMRNELWIRYSDLCVAHFDQYADDKAPFSVTLLPAETIAANLAAME